MPHRGVQGSAQDRAAIRSSACWFDEGADRTEAILGRYRLSGNAPPDDTAAAEFGNRVARMKTTTGLQILSKRSETTHVLAGATCEYELSTPAGTLSERSNSSRSPSP